MRGWTTSRLLRKLLSSEACCHRPSYHILAEQSPKTCPMLWARPGPPSDRTAAAQLLVVLYVRDRGLAALCLSGYRHYSPEGKLFAILLFQQVLNHVAVPSGNCCHPSLVLGNIHSLATQSGPLGTGQAVNVKVASVQLGQGINNRPEGERRRNTAVGQR